MSKPVIDPFETITFDEGYRRLRKESEKATPAPKVEGGKLPLRDIALATAVFQPRLGKGQEWAFEPHVATLAAALRDKPKQALDPVLVWWSGTKWRLVDGHHRVAAYRQVTTKQKGKKLVSIERVPVEVFPGSLDDAVVEATKRNVKDKLPMTKSDKLEMAWRFVGMDKHSISQIADATGVAARTVSNMRKVAAAMTELDPTGMGSTKGPIPTTVKWKEAQQWGKPGYQPWDEAQVDKAAEEFARRIKRTFGTALARNPGLTLKALQYYSQSMYDRMVELLAEDIKAEAEDYDDGEGDDEGNGQQKHDHGAF